MSDSKDSILSQGLSTEDRQWVRALADHRGFQCFLRAVKSLQDSAGKDLLSSEELHKIYRAQGEVKALTQVLGLYQTLLARAPKPSGGNV